jgi:phosphoribosylformimino-5-aminoimidazole carboxamide ribotide isomerase
MIDIIPAIDIIEGKCVRLSQGDYQRVTTYREDPLEVALEFQDAGIHRLHLVDLDGAKAKHIVNWRVLERIANRTSLVIDFGGGLKSDSDLKVAFDSGASMITGGSIAVRDRETFTGWIEQFGADRIILGADVKGENISITGWTEETTEPVIPFVGGYVDKGITKVISTDISRDGMLTGPSFELYSKLLDAFPELFVIASGGVSTMGDILQLEAANVPGVITGKALYEGRITLDEIRRYIIQNQ